MSRMNPDVPSVLQTSVPAPLHLPGRVCRNLQAMYEIHHCQRNVGDVGYTRMWCRLYSPCLPFSLKSPNSCGIWTAYTCTRGGSRTKTFGVVDHTCVPTAAVGGTDLGLGVGGRLWTRRQKCSQTETADVRAFRTIKRFCSTATVIIYTEQ